MIAHVIGRRQSFGRVLAYLAGPGRGREHVDPQVIASDREAALFVGELDRDAVRLAAEHLDTPRVAFGSSVKEPVWHAVLAQKAGEPALTPERWGNVADAYMHGMGFDRYVVVHHGKTAKGVDHAHVVGSMVRDNGRAMRWDKQSAFHRSRAVRQQIERDFGLKGIASEQAGLEGMPGLPRGRSAQERDDVATRVRAAHIEAGREDRFPGRLRAHGLEFEPRRAENGRVTGVKYRLPGGNWYQGSKLAPDLSLPRMRAMWREPTSAQQVSGAFASMSRATERTPGSLARASREVSRSARMAGGHSVRLAALLANPEKGASEWLLIGATAIKAAQALHGRHVESGHAGMAEELARVRDYWAQAQPGLSASARTERPQARWLEQDRSADRNYELGG